MRWKSSNLKKLLFHIGKIAGGVIASGIVNKTSAIAKIGQFLLSVGSGFIKKGDNGDNPFWEAFFYC